MGSVAAERKRPCLFWEKGKGMAFWEETKMLNGKVGGEEFSVKSGIAGLRNFFLKIGYVRCKKIENIMNSGGNRSSGFRRYGCRVKPLHRNAVFAWRFIPPTGL
jgi:hypothetical protein